MDSQLVTDSSQARENAKIVGRWSRIFWGMSLFIPLAVSYTCFIVATYSVTLLWYMLPLVVEVNNVDKSGALSQGDLIKIVMYLGVLAFLEFVILALPIAFQIHQACKLLESTEIGHNGHQAFEKVLEWVLCQVIFIAIQGIGFFYYFRNRWSIYFIPSLDIIFWIECASLSCAGVFLAIHLFSVFVVIKYQIELFN